THAPAPPASGRHAPVQPSGGGTQAGRLVLSCPSWTPRTQIVRCPRNRGNFSRRFVDRLSSFGVVPRKRLEKARPKAAQDHQLMLFDRPAVVASPSRPTSS